MQHAGSQCSEHNSLRSTSVFQTGLSVEGSSEAEPVSLATQDMPEEVLIEHPDAALLILCGKLRTLQEQWQRLWAATPEVGEPGPADAAWRDYSDHVWPGVSRQGVDCASDPVRGLIAIKATTLEGMRAKAAAINALDDAGGYLMSVRDDSYELMMSLLQDVAGPAAMLIGEDAEQIAAVAAE